MSHVSEFQSILEKGVEAVLPDRLVKQSLSLIPDGIQVNGTAYPVSGQLNIFGFGKAALGLVKAALKILGSRVENVVCCAPQPTEHEIKEYPDLCDVNEILTSDGSKPNIFIFNGPRTNEPNAEVVRASLKMAKIASSMKTGDLLLVCITGGGSALLTLPAPLEKGKLALDESVNRLSLEAIIKTTKMLSLDGASIQDLNSVRSCLDCMKAGGLACYAAPAKVVSLILSDVIGDPIQFIASGPTYIDSEPDTEVSPYDKALAVLKRRGLIEKVPVDVRDFLEARKGTSMRPTAVDPVPTNCLIGSLSLALEAAANEAAKLNPCCLTTNRNVLPRQIFRRTPPESFECILPIILTDKLDNDMTQRAEAIADLSWEIRRLTLVFLARPEKTSRHVTDTMRERLVNAQTRLIGKKTYYRDLVHACYQVAKVANEEISMNHTSSGQFLSGICLIFGGEATVKVNVKSLTSNGGRCSHAALATALRLYELQANSNSKSSPPSSPTSIQISFYARASDGLDGPTAFGAGAWSTDELIEDSAEAGRAKQCLMACDSYGYFANGSRIDADKGHYLPAQLTGTNVMDLFMCLIGIYA
nr:glycerate kinase [Hymenolepis microstoma]